MDSFPEDAIYPAEQEILTRLLEVYQIRTDTLFYDTTNFFTYIDTTNTNCDIAQRGKNKQKRNDLRQVGLAMVVSKVLDAQLYWQRAFKDMLDARLLYKMALAYHKKAVGLI